MEPNNINKITNEWLKDNGWRCFNYTANITINERTYYLRTAILPDVNSIDYYSGKAKVGDFNDSPYYLSKLIAGVAAVEVVEMLTSTGQEFDEDKMIPLKPGDTPISRNWGRENGWDEIENGVCIKCINGVWYELEYSDFDCDYILKKRIATVTDICELEAVVK